VKFTLPDGEEGEILATFKYRTREEHGEWLNAMNKDAPPDFVKDGRMDFAAMFRDNVKRSAQDLLAALVSWDLEAPLNLESLTGMANEVPAAAIALATAYQRACQEGRLGN
jgi:hypothetical protein